MTNGKIARFLLEHNKEQSEIYRSPDETLARRQYRASHPTEIAALKCMDGRLNLPIITKTPWGIIQPFRNVGGAFDFGWPFFGQLILDWVGYSTMRARDCVLLITYHWSKGDVHRGCKGFNYDVQAAREHTEGLKKQAERIFGGRHFVVYPIQIGVETDEDAITLHGRDGDALNLSQIGSLSPEEMRIMLEKLYPDMKPKMIDDLLPLVLGNIKHIDEIRKLNRPARAVEHSEDTIALGRGFSWLHIPNKALIIGPYSYDLAQPVATAAKIVLDNLNKGRIPKGDGAVLMVSALYREASGPERPAAVEKADSLARFAVETVKREVPELMPHLSVLVGTVDSDTMFFTKQESVSR